MAFRCEECRYQETVWGHVSRDPDGVDRFTSAPKKILTVLMCSVPNGVLCRGICEDTNLFELLFSNVDAAIRQIGKHYAARGMHCVFDLPKGTNHDKQA